MHAKRHRILHWTLIIALAVLPLRNALAVNPGCGMHEHDGSSSSSNAMGDHAGHMAMNGHAGHRMMNHTGPIAGVDHMAHQGAEKPITKHHCCCCDSAKGSCSPDCSMGLHASAIMASIFAMTASYKSQIVAITAYALQTRELTPPSRPPLSLYV
jgi:hypothetical protein